jgi:hypothetical protein
LQLAFVFLEYTFVVVFPELLRGIFACYTGEDFLSAWCCTASAHTSLSLVIWGWELGLGRGGIGTRMLILERCQVVDILVDNNVEVVGLVVRCDVCLGEGLRHLALRLS